MSCLFLQFHPSSIGIKKKKIDPFLYFTSVFNPRKPLDKLQHTMQTILYLTFFT